eukprot:Amastigsp_a180648_9.p1 type:complete len:469 gc:universal Amastigsp_a180648_9:124-1530(+)
MRVARALRLCALLIILLGLERAALGEMCAPFTVLQTPTGVITDGSGIYTPDRTCVFLIEVPDGRFVTLNVTSVELECGWDFLYIYDGDSNASPLLAALSGRLQPQLPIVLASSTSALYLVFISDPYVVDDGFYATYSSSMCPSNCSSHGVCLANATCLCDDGYTGAGCATLTPAPSRCEAAGEDPLKRCVCAEGFRADYTQWMALFAPATVSAFFREPECAAAVPPPPVCNDACVSEPDLINRQPSVDARAAFVQLACPESCNPSCVNGTCNQQYGHCVCNEGYTGRACDERQRSSSSTTGAPQAPQLNKNGGRSNVFRGAFLFAFLLLLVIVVLVVTLTCRRRPPPRRQLVLLGVDPAMLARDVPLFVVELKADGSAATPEQPFPIIIEDDDGAVASALVVIETPPTSEPPTLARFVIGALAAGLGGDSGGTSTPTRSVEVSTSRVNIEVPSLEDECSRSSSSSSST